MSEELKKEKENIQDNNQESLEVNLSDETTQQENDQQPGDEEGQPKAEPTTEEQLEAAKKEIEDLNDKLLRKIAEFDNYRKRTMKEKTELILNGGERTVVAILPVIDDLERALKNMKQADDIAAVVEGVELVYKKFIDTLKKQGVEPIQTEGADFDVDLHEAIAQLPAPTDELKGKVMDCTLTGYKMNEKVIRHSQVVVGL
ncbi:nucleotide exchange factor GrpE [bacterium]|nr:nucleotide exchange factor GrpE [bacterium]